MRKLINTLIFTIAITNAITNPAVADVSKDKHTGNVIVSSKREEIVGGLLSTMHATAVFSTRKGYGIGVEYLATGGSWVHFSEVWSNGKQFRFDAAAGQVLGCSSGCSLQEGGAIRLTQTEFNRAAMQGFEFKIIGSGGALVGKVPADLFRQVLGDLARMNTSQN